MNRVLSLIGVGVVTAVATYAVREWLEQSADSRHRSAPRPALDTWEYEGGNLAPHEERPLQQQLG